MSRSRKITAADMAELHAMLEDNSHIVHGISNRAELGFDDTPTFEQMLTILNFATALSEIARRGLFPHWMDENMRVTAARLKAEMDPPIVAGHGG